MMMRGLGMRRARRVRRLSSFGGKLGFVGKKGSRHCAFLRGGWRSIIGRLRWMRHSTNGVAFSMQWAFSIGMGFIAG